MGAYDNEPEFYQCPDCHMSLRTDDDEVHMCAPRLRKLAAERSTPRLTIPLLWRMQAEMMGGVVSFTETDGRGRRWHVTLTQEGE